jgi:hypothetical protein
MRLSIANVGIISMWSKELKSECTIYDNYVCTMYYHFSEAAAPRGGGTHVPAGVAQASEMGTGYRVRGTFHSVAALTFRGEASQHSSTSMRSMHAGVDRAGRARAWRGPSQGGPDPSLPKRDYPTLLSLSTPEHSSHGVQSREPCDEDHQSSDHR